MHSPLMGDADGMADAGSGSRIIAREKRKQQGKGNSGKEGNTGGNNVLMAPRVSRLGAALFSILVGASSASPANALPKSHLTGMSNTMGSAPLMQVYEFPPRANSIYSGSDSRADKLEAESWKYKTRENGYEIPLGEGMNQNGKNNSISVGIDAKTKSVSVRPISREGSSQEAYPNGKPFLLGYSNLGINDPQLLIEDGVATFNICLFDRETGREARFKVRKDSPKPDSIRLELYQDLTEGYFSRVAGSLEELPKFGAESKKGYLSRFLARVHVQALRELRRIAPKVGEHTPKEGASEDAFGKLLDDFILAYQDISKSVWGRFVSEAAKTRGKEKRKELLEHGKRLVVALMCRPYAIENPDPSTLEKLDSLIGRGLPEKEFMQFITDNYYTKIYEHFGGKLEPQMKVLLGAGFHEASNR